MKLLLTAVTLVLLSYTSMYHVQAQGNAICTASGDPHIFTFDKAGVHFQGYGTFLVAEATNGFRVEASFRRVGNVVTAVRSFSAQLISQEGRIRFTTVVAFGSWPGTPAYPNNTAAGFTYQAPIAGTIDPLYIKTSLTLQVAGRAPTSTECTTTTNEEGINYYVCNIVNLLSKSVHIGRVTDTGFSLRYILTPIRSSNVHGRLTIQEILPTGQNGPVRIDSSHYYVAVTLPKADPYISKTNGLCGFYDGLLGNWEFIDANNTNLVTDVLANKWYANVATNKWAWSFNVLPGFSLVSQHFGHLIQGTEHEVQNVMPNVDFENKLVFKSLDDLRNAEAVCEQQVADQNFVPPCVFDVAALTTDTQAAVVADASGFVASGYGALNAYSLAFSNVLASEAVASNSNSGSAMSSATVATIALGAVALLGMMTMLVTFFKLRHVRSVIMIASASNNSVEMNRTV